LKRLISVFSILFVFGCSSNVTTLNPEKCIMYRTGKQAYPDHDPHRTRIFSAMAWNKDYMTNGYNLLELERHMIRCEH